MNKPNLAFLLILFLCGLFSPNLSLLSEQFPLTAQFSWAFSISLYLPFWIYLYLQIKKSKQPKFKFFLSLILVGVLGYIYELLSINFGFPYGKFQYGNLMGGAKIFNQVPLVLPVIYVALVQSTYFFSQSISQKKNLSNLHTILIGSLLLMFLDIVIDPGLTINQVWTWQTSLLGLTLYNVPLQNFLGWFLTSCISLTILTKLQTKPIIPPTSLTNFWLLSPILFSLVFWLANSIQYSFWLSTLVGLFLLTFISKNNS